MLCLSFSPLRACKRAFQRGPPDDSQACLGTADVPQTRVDCETIDACAALLAAITTGTKNRSSTSVQNVSQGAQESGPEVNAKKKEKSSGEKPGGLRLNRTDETESRRRRSAISTSAGAPL